MIHGKLPMRRFERQSNRNGRDYEQKTRFMTPLQPTSKTIPLDILPRSSSGTRSLPSQPPPATRAIKRDNTRKDA